MNPTSQSLSEVHALKCELAEEVLRSSGRLRLKVTGWSMLPSIWPGDVLMIDCKDTAEISKGDIVLYKRDRRLTVHRIVRNQSLQPKMAVLTRGDAMPACDRPVSACDLLGRVNLILRGTERIVPRRRLSIPESVIAVLVKRSKIVAQIMVRTHDFLVQDRFQGQQFNNRAASCQN